MGEETRIEEKRFWVEKERGNEGKGLGRKLKRGEEI